MAAGRGQSADGAWRRRDGCAATARLSHSGASAARLESREEPCFGIGHGYVQCGTDRDCLRTVLSRVGSRAAMAELDSPRRWELAGPVVPGPRPVGPPAICLTP